MTVSKHETELQNERDYEEFLDSCEEVDRSIQNCLVSLGERQSGVFMAVLTKLLIDLAKSAGHEKKAVLEAIAETYDDDEDNDHWDTKRDFH